MVDLMLSTKIFHYDGSLQFKTDGRGLRSMYKFHNTDSLTNEMIIKAYKAEKASHY